MSWAWSALAETATRALIDGFMGQLGIILQVWALTVNESHIKFQSSGTYVQKHTSTVNRRKHHLIGFFEISTSHIHHLKALSMASSTRCVYMSEIRCEDEESCDHSFHEKAKKVGWSNLGQIVSWALIYYT